MPDNLRHMALRDRSNLACRLCGCRTLWNVTSWHEILSLVRMVYGQVLEGEMQAEREAHESMPRPLLVDTDTGEVRMEPV